MKFEEIKQYWDSRAALDNTAQSTTMDYYFREIEYQVLNEIIKKYQPGSVMDIGCGDARTTAKLASIYNNALFIGADYSISMLDNARICVNASGITNLQLLLYDVLHPVECQEQEMIYSTRCLINLPSWELQLQAIINIHKSLAAGGIYVMIENFVEGHDKFNSIRAKYELPLIPIREHNRFFEYEKLKAAISDYFCIIDDVNISSSYYLVSRIIYSKLCQIENCKPDYFDFHHEYAAKLPFCGEYGPTRMICLRRK